LALEAGKDNPAVQAFIDECKAMETSEAAMETMEKKGIDSGLKCTPLTRYTPITQTIVGFLTT
jgi:leucyl-tRNA synthetase